MRSSPPSSSRITTPPVPNASDDPTVSGSFDSRRVLTARLMTPITNDDYESGTPHSINSISRNSSPMRFHDDLDGNNSVDYKAFGRHLVSNSNNNNSKSSSALDGEFNSLSLQGGDTTRDLYKIYASRERLENSNSSINNNGSSSTIGSDEFSSNNNQKKKKKRSRSHSFSNLENDVRRDSISSIRVPGGFRRSFLIQKAINNGQLPLQTNLNPIINNQDNQNDNEGLKLPLFLTRNFVEFLSVYGHFAGEELEDDEDDDKNDIENQLQSNFENVIEDEETPLLSSSTSNPNNNTKNIKKKGTISSVKACFLLLKSFVGTGVLFLPKAYSNGGLIFCTILLIFFAILNYWCFLLLLDSKKKVKVSSFGDLGNKLYGNYMRLIILFSIVLSQIGFSSAYIIFTSENLKSFFDNFDHNLFNHNFTISELIFLQILIFLPLSMIRNIGKLSFTSFLANFMILIGLIYICYSSLKVLNENGISKKIEFLFNSKSWTLFIGTAIFTFEGIGLIIPVQESMAKPENFKFVLKFTMILITFIFIFVAILCYLTFGSKVETIVLLSLPKDNNLINIIQLLYSMAILLSTPLQLFPAIRIMENGLFKSSSSNNLSSIIISGKSNLRIKWKKNFFRYFIVLISILIAYYGSNDLDKFVSIIGSFACIPLVYIYPPLLHYKAFKNDKYGKVIDCLGIGFGVIMMVYTTWSSLLL